jgi:hypothetical protein
VITQVVPKIRPLWIAIASALFVLCAGVAICTAIFGVGMNVILSPRVQATERPTSQSVPTQVVIAPTVAVISSGLPTQIPLPNATNVNSAPLPAPINTGDPANTVRTYYQWVDANRYDLTWPMLSAHFKDVFNCCAPNYNYGGYTDWWNSVDRVEAVDVRTVQQDSGRAVVYMELHYWMKAGGQSIDRGYIHLVSDPVAGWLFDNKTDTL